jgi:hypothetical protein
MFDVVHFARFNDQKTIINWLKEFFANPITIRKICAGIIEQPELFDRTLWGSTLVQTRLRSLGIDIDDKSKGFMYVVKDIGFALCEESPRIVGRVPIVDGAGDIPIPTVQPAATTPRFDVTFSGSIYGSGWFKINYTKRLNEGRTIVHGDEVDELFDVLYDEVDTEEPNTGTDYDTYEELTVHDNDITISHVEFYDEDGQRHVIDDDLGMSRQELDDIIYDIVENGDDQYME